MTIRQGNVLTGRMVNQPAPTEAQEQEALFDCIRRFEGRYPLLRLVLHVPNGGGRHKAEAIAFHRRGVRAGVPDICVPVSREDHGALWVELKRRGGRLSPEQLEWHEMLGHAGHRVVVCYGWLAAWREITGYLGIATGADGAPV